jgi:hypothetical protein
MSTTADKYYVGPPSGQVWEIHRIIIDIRDAGTVNADTFGAISSLTTGCTLGVTNGGVDGTTTLDLTDGLTIKNNGNLGRYCYDFNISTATAGDKAVTARWTFNKSGAPIRLSGGLDQKLVFNVQDDLTNLSEMTVMAQGQRIT